MKLVKKLPDPFPLTDGNRVASVEDWKVRRSEIVALLMTTQYGTMPDATEVTITRKKMPKL